MKQLERMLTFSAVVEAGSFTAAAEQLKCSKAHVSQQISRLEETLGVQLLFRTTRRLELTEAGETFLEYCRQLESTSRAARSAVERLRGAMTGTLRMTVPVSFGHMALERLIRPFLDQYPEIDVQLELENNITDLRAQRMDFALRTPAPADEELVALRLTDYRELLCASPAYLNEAGTIRSPEDLSARRLLVNRHGQEDSWRLWQNGRRVDIPIERHMLMNHYAALRDAALLGLGITRVPIFVVEADIEEGRLVEVLPDYDASAVRPIYLVYPWQKSLPLKNRRFIDHVLEAFGQSPMPRAAVNTE